MKNSEEILPPDRYAIDQEVDDLFEHGDLTKVSLWSGIKYQRLAHMLRIDDPLENCVSESIAMVFGLVKHEKNNARKLARIYDRHFITWRLFEDSPLALMQSAIDRLSQLKSEEVKRMSDDDQQKVLVGISIIEDLIPKLKSAACNGRHLIEQPY